jgi:hypothetical protein
MTDLSILASKLSEAEKSLIITGHGEKISVAHLNQLGLLTYEPIYHSVPGLGRKKIGYKAGYTDLGLSLRSYLKGMEE